MSLKGVKVIELAGLAPAPFCGMILSDFGASVIRVDNPNSGSYDVLSRGKRSVSINLRSKDGVEVFKKLCKRSDVVLEPFRAGVMEKLQLGPTILCRENPRLIYARLTGFGQTGKFSKMAGHDINYIGLSGVLSTMGPHGHKPYPPINLLGDFAGGGLMCAMGICMALLERVKSNQGQVIDTNMVQGSAYIGSWLWLSHFKDDFNLWASERGKNVLDGGAPFYQTYKTKDGKFMAVGAIEPQFYDQLLEGLGLSSDDHPHIFGWEKSTEIFTKTFASKTQEEWCKVFDYKDACVTPVVPLEEAHRHEHNSSSEAFYEDDGNYVPKPAPNFSRTPGLPSLEKATPGQHTEEILQELGYTDDEIVLLKKERAVQGLKSTL